jgi:hypothetical protein
MRASSGLAIHHEDKEKEWDGHAACDIIVWQPS